MARHQTHRGLAPGDERLFGAKRLPGLRAAAADLCWLLDRGYALRSSVELVGNRYSLAGRQRMGLARFACSREDIQHRQERCIDAAHLSGRELWVDAYNVLTILESALSGGIVFLSRDGCCRDIAGIHRRYRKVNETIPVLRMAGELMSQWGVSRCRWWLDKPVSNSGRLRALILEVAAQHHWNMSAELTLSPDYVLSHTNEVIATSDGVVLDRCRRWVNLARSLIAERIPQARVLDLSPPTG